MWVQLHRNRPTPWPSVALPCSCSEEKLRGLTQELGACGAMAYTTVVGAHRGRPLGERYAAVCAAMAMGEHIRDGGAHALVVLDDISCMVTQLGWQCSGLLWWHVALAGRLHETGLFGGAGRCWLHEWCLRGPLI